MVNFGKCGQYKGITDIGGEILHLQIKINDENKIVSLWFGNEEINEEVIKNVDEELDEYKKQKYKICLYQSGKEDIKKNVLDLILNNV